MKIFKSLVVLCCLSLLFAGFTLKTARAQIDLPGSPNVAPDAPAATKSLYLPIMLRLQPSIFGVEMASELADSSTGGGPDLASKAGAIWVRRNALIWSDVEPTPGARLWNSTLDQELINAQKFNLHPILIIRGTPSWAQMYAGNYCGPMRADAIDDFANFVRDAVTRYSSPPYYVQYFELWNEPDVDHNFFDQNAVFGCWGDATDAYFGGGYYAQMLKQVYPAIKGVNSNLQVLIGGLLLDCDPNNPPAGKNCLPSKFFQGILAGGGGNYFDGVSFHAYDYFHQPADKWVYSSSMGVYDNSNWASKWNTTGPVMMAKVNYLRGLLSQYGFSSKYLINTELALICDSNTYVDYCQTTPEELSFQNTKAFYVVQTYAAGRYLKLKANIWYSFTGWRASGLYDADINQPEIAYNAYSFAAKELNQVGGATEIQPATSVKGYEFTKSDRRIWVIWYVGGDPSNGNLTTQVNLPGVPKAVYRWIALGSGEANAGAYQPAATSQNLTVGRAPVFVELNP